MGEEAQEEEAETVTPSEAEPLESPERVAELDLVFLERANLLVNRGCDGSRATQTRCSLLSPSPPARLVAPLEGLVLVVQARSKHIFQH